nr:LysR substrate-binding domain-containing protein [Geomicrobium sp. JCM 19037]
MPNNKRILYQTDPYLTAIIDNWWRDQYKQPPSVSITTNTMEIAQKFCEQGLGYMIAPEMMIPKDSRLTIQPIQTENGENIMWPTRLVYKQQTTDLNLVQKFVEHIKKL